VHILVEEDLDNASPGDLDDLGFDLFVLRELRGIPSEPNLHPHILIVLVALVSNGDQSEIMLSDILNFRCEGDFLGIDCDKLHFWVWS
jgi:hypothetical protein